MRVRIVVACCLLWLAFGPAVAIYGATAPAIIDEWRLSPTFAGALGSCLTIGMLIGSVVVGTVDGLIGTKASITGALTFALIGTALCAVAPSPAVLGVLLAIARDRLGSGAAAAHCLQPGVCVGEAQEPRLCGGGSLFSLGNVLTSALAIPVLPNLGWRPLYLLCAVPMVIAVPFVLTAPESVASLVTRGRTEQGRQLAARLDMALSEPSEPTKGDTDGLRRWFRGIALLFSRTHVAATLLFWVGMFCSYVLVFSLIVWLPS